MRKNKCVALALTLVLGLAQIMTVQADVIDEVRQKKSQTSSQLESTKGTINTLEQQKNQLLDEIDSLDASLIQTIATINGLKESISDKETEIEETKVRLAAAEENRKEQYEAMKKRIQYLYENGGNISWITVLLADGNISDLLESASRTQELYDYDKKALDQYASIVQEVTDLSLELQGEKADLESMKQAQEEEQQNLEQMLNEKRATCTDYESQIAAAEAIAQQYQQLIREQNAQIQELVAQQQRQAEEEARKQAAAEEEAKRKEEENKKHQNNSNNTNSNNNNSSGNNSNTSSGNNSSNNNSANNSNQGNGNSSSGNANIGNNSSGNTSSSKAKGQEIIDYACNFIGNPYVWAGNSLTNGIDCSGFIHQIYKHFGYNVPRQSTALRSAGRGVSFAEAQPGDIICYEGHVALYMEGGGIIHASNSAPYPAGGIKISPNAAYRPILAVRRVVS